MARIERAYENKFRAILGSVRTREFDKAVQWLQRRAEQLSIEGGMSRERAWAQVYEHARARLQTWRRAHRPVRGPAGPAAVSGPPQFVCDAGLGGLARWLRAAGYESHWRADIDDDEVVREAQGLAAILLTTDSLLMERRILREGVIRSCWFSPALKTGQQLETVLRELELPLLQPRCMKCGGQLVQVEKESLGARIPPKTYRWLAEYFVCERCGKLFWHGTHWERIRAQLQKAGG